MRRLIRPWLLSLALAAVLAALGCSVYHLEAKAFLGLLGLGLLIVVPGASVVGLLKLDERFRRAECAVIAVSLGVIMSALVLWLEVMLRAPSLDAIYVALFAATLAKRRQRAAIGSALSLFAYLLPAAIAFVLCYNLGGFHYTADGSIVARGLWGVDIPFLAGEVHGLRQFGHLVDLHQSALPWDYHDATYRILALFAKAGVLDLLAWVEPIFGYVAMAIGVYAVVDRLTRNRIAAILTTLLWFFSGALMFGTQLSYAISPTFVFGTILLSAFLITFDVWRFGSSTKLGLLVLVLLVALSRFKLSTFLVAEFALGVLGVWHIVKDRRAAGMTLSLAFVAGLQFLAIGTPTNPLTPAADFLVGAPLLGYANHLAHWLHISVTSINPVTHASVSWRSLLVPIYFVFHFLRFVVLDPRLLVAIVGGYLLVRRRHWESSPTLRLLYVALPLGFLLPVLYSPAWYPLALSFYAPLVSIQAAVLVLGAVLDGMMKRRPRGWQVAVVAAVILGSVVVNIRQMRNDVRQPSFTISSDLRSALEWIASAETPGTLAARRYDLEPNDTVNDESFYWYSALSEQPVITEGAKYGALLGAVGDIDREKGLHRVRAAEFALRMHRAENAWLFYSGDTALVYSTIRSVPVRYLLERTTGALPDEQVHVDLHKIGRIAFEKGNVRVWQFY